MNTFCITMAIFNVQCCLPVAPLSKPFYMLVIVKILWEISENSEINCFKYLFSLRRFLFPKFLDQCSQGKQCALHPACMPFKFCLDATDFSCSHLPFWNLKQNWSREDCGIFLLLSYLLGRFLPRVCLNDNKLPCQHLFWAVLNSALPSN